MARALDGQAHSPLRPAIDARGETTVHGVATEDPDGPTFEASVLVRVDIGRGAHRTLLARASGDDVAALRVIEAGDHVVLAGPPGRARNECVRRSGALAPRRRADSTRRVWSTCRPRTGSSRSRTPLGPSSCAAPVRSRRRPRALVAGFLLGDTRGIPDAGHRRLPRLGALAPARGVGRERRVRDGARRTAAPPPAARRHEPRAALAIVVVFAAMTRFEPSVLRGVGDGRDRAARDAQRAPRVDRARARLRRDRAAPRRSVPVALRRVRVVVRCECRHRVPVPPDRRAPPGSPRGCANRSRSPSAPSSACCRCCSGSSATFPLITPVANLAAAPAAEVLGVYGFFAVGGRRSRARRSVRCSSSPPRLLVAVDHLGRRAPGRRFPFRIDGRGVRSVVEPPVLAAAAAVGSLPPCPPSSRSRRLRLGDAPSTSAAGSS